MDESLRIRNIVHIEKKWKELGSLNYPKFLNFHRRTDLWLNECVEIISMRFHSIWISAMRCNGEKSPVIGHTFTHTLCILYATGTCTVCANITPEYYEWFHLLRMRKAFMCTDLMKSPRRSPFWYAWRRWPRRSTEFKFSHYQHSFYHVKNCRFSYLMRIYTRM